jgi:hypothetical protein
MSNLSQGRPDRFRGWQKARLPKSGYGIILSGPPVNSLRIVIKRFDGALSAIRNRWGKRSKPIPYYIAKAAGSQPVFLLPCNKKIRFKSPRPSPLHAASGTHGGKKHPPPRFLLFTFCLGGCFLLPCNKKIRFKSPRPSPCEGMTVRGRQTLLLLSTNHSNIKGL